MVTPLLPIHNLITVLPFRVTVQNHYVYSFYYIFLS